VIMSVRNAVLSVVVLLGLVITDAAQAAPNLYGLVSPSVVYLEHEIYMDPTACRHPDLWQRFTQVTKHPFLSTYFPMASGSGLFVDDQGHIVTNHHVAVIEKIAEWRHAAEEGFAKWVDQYLVKDFSSAERDALKDDVVRLFEGGKYRFAAMVGNQFVGEVNVLSVADKDGPDLALVQAGTSSTPSLQLASASDIGSVLIGQDVFSLGYPLGFELDAMFKERVVTLNKGIVSAYRESDSLDIQHSAAISHGNSGGPLVDSRGEVIGINSAGLQEAQGNSLFYAIGMAKVRDFLTKAGYGQMLVWNERLAHMGEQENGLRANAQGELETSSTLVVDVPKASSIKVDGVEKGHGPLTLTLANPLSTLEVTDDVGTFTARLRMATAQQGGTSTLRLTPRGAVVSVSFTSDPPGAAVFADSRPLGSTPLQVGLPPGDYAIKYQLSGYVFEESKLHLPAANPVEFASIGKKTYPVALKIRDDISKTSLAFSSESGEYHFEHVTSVALPRGDYQLAVTGLESLEGVSIPIHIGDGPSEIDLEAVKKRANLLIRGFDTHAQLWVDSEEQPLNCANPLLLTVGTHSVAIWEDGRLPLQGTDVNVRSDNSSFVTWNNGTGNDVWSARFGWTGLGLGVTGAALAVVGLYFDSDSVAIANSTSYSGYTSIKNLAGASMVAGFAVIGVAAVSELVAFIERRAFETEKQNFKASLLVKQSSVK
jgi:Trypsin-like peptidase domain/PEGA domain